MSNEIVIIDYGMGNLHSVTKAIAKVGGDPVVTSDIEVISRAQKVVLPGVGAFGDCMLNLEKAGLVPVIKELAAKGTPLLGICLGMQVLFEGSEETPGVAGLGIFKGQVKKLTTDLKIPHMGWNCLSLKSPSPLTAGAEGQYVYFDHSYHCVPEDTGIITAVSDYHQEVVACVGRDNVQAFQFHPEKSSSVGMSLLKAFKEWKP